MARIAGVDLPRTKRVETGLQYIYGVGPHRSKKILAEVKIERTSGSRISRKRK